MTDSQLTRFQRGKPTTPLFGSKTHPLTPHALSVLADLALEPIVASEVNAGVINRFQREDLAEFQNLPSPYKVDKGGKRPFLVITEAGRKVLAEKAAK